MGETLREKNPTGVCAPAWPRPGAAGDAMGLLGEGR